MTIRESGKKTPKWQPKPLKTSKRIFPEALSHNSLLRVRDYIARLIETGRI